MKKLVITLTTAIMVISLATGTWAASCPTGGNTGWSLPNGVALPTGYTSQDIRDTVSQYIKGGSCNTGNTVCGGNDCTITNCPNPNTNCAQTDCTTPAVNGNVQNVLTSVLKQCGITTDITKFFPNCPTTPVVTPKPTQTPAPVETPKPTQTPTPVETPKPTQTPAPVETPKPTQTPAPVETPKPTQTPAPVETPKPTQTPAPVETPKPVETTPPATNLSFEEQVVVLVNQERAAYGLSPLTLNAELSNVARAKSQDMRDLGYFSHTSPTYGSPFDMMKAFGISYRAAGENIAMGYSTPEAVMKGWMNSEGHRANILSGNFTQIGVGYVASGNYWTQMFIG